MSSKKLMLASVDRMAVFAAIIVDAGLRARSKKPYHTAGVSSAWARLNVWVDRQSDQRREQQGAAVERRVLTSA